MATYRPSAKTGEYEELREKCKQLIDLGFKLSGLIQDTNVSESSVYDWIKRNRNLNHETAKKIEQALDTLKQKVNNII